MGNIVELNYENTADMESIAAVQNTLDGPLDTMAGQEPAGFFETAGLVYKTETIIGSTVAHGFSKDRVSGHYVYDKQFNPYRYFMENQEQYGDIEQHVRKKLFHDVVNEEQFLDRAQRLRLELEDRERLAGGSGWGMVAGMGLSLLDLSTLVPVGGWFHKGNTLARAGKLALAGGTLTAGQETVLHMQQDLRTYAESVMAVGLGTGFGGALGAGVAAFSRAREPGNLLDPMHPDNPMKSTNPFVIGVGRIGAKMSESAVISPVLKKGKQTFEVLQQSKVGKAVGADVAKIKQTGEALKAPIVSSLAKITPLGRMIYAKSEFARGVAMKLMDTGGILVKSMGLGESQLSIEDLVARYMYISDNNFLDATEAYITLRLDLEKAIHGSVNETAIKATDRVREAARLGQETYQKVLRRETDDYLGKNSAHFEEFEFVDLTYKQIFDDITDIELDNLTKRFGKEGAEKIVGAAKARAAAIHKINGTMEDLMVRERMITEKQRMGDDYGIAQLWNPAAMRGAKRDQIVKFFIEKFAGRPTDDFLDGYKMTIDDFDDLGTKDVTIDGQTYTPSQGKAFKQEVLEEWSGDVMQREELMANVELQIAIQQENNARRSAVLAASDLRKNNTQIKRAAVDEAKKILKLRQAEREKAQAETQRLGLEKQEIDTTLRRLEAELKERLSQFHETGSFKRKYKEAVPKVTPEGDVLPTTRSEATTAISNLEKQLDDLNQIEGGASVKSIDDVHRMLTEADNQLEQIDANILDAAVHEASLKPVYNHAIGKLKERQRMIAKDLSRLNRRLQRLGPKVDALDDAVKAADDAHRNLKGRTANLKEIQKKARSEQRKAKRNVKSKKKSVRRAEGKLPVHEYVEDMVRKMGKQQSIPNGFLEAHHFSSGRTKDRQIHLTNEERRMLIEMGALRNDVYAVMRQAHQDITTRLAMRQLFGTENVDDVIKEVNANYKDLIEDAQSRNLSEKHQTSIANEQKRMEKDIRGIWERHLGIHELPRDTEGWGLWGMKKLREWNFIRYGTGFLISSLTDLATVTMQVGFGALTMRNIRALRETTKGMRSDEIRRMAVHSEAVLHANRNMKIAGLDDLKQLSGIGDHGSLKHEFTSTADRVVNGLTETANFLSGMSWWNTRLKALAMLEMQHNMYEQLAKTVRRPDGTIVSSYEHTLQLASAGDKAAEKQIALLASSGLGKEQARRLIKMMNKHKPDGKEGTYELEMNRWLDEGIEGQMAYEDAMTAFRRVANRAVMTPGVGDTPLFMSKPVWKTIGQFQTYGFVAVNRYVVPGVQRGMTYNDMDALLSFGFTTLMGSNVVLLKDMMNNGEIKDRNVGEWMYDIVDRSGMLMYMSTPSAGVYNMAAYWVGSKSRPSRYSQTSSRLATMGGPAGGLANDILDTFDSARYGQGAAAGEKAMKLLPFQNYLRIAQQIHNNLD